MVLDIAREISFFLLIIVCAFTDIAKGHVYNWATFPGLAVGIALAALSGLDAQSWLPLVNCGIGIFIGYGTLWLFYRMGQLGGGDVKLMGAVGALQGVHGYRLVIWTLFFSALIGSVVGIAIALWTGKFWSSLRGAGRTLVLQRDSPTLAGAESGGIGAQAGVTIPFGFAIAAGGIWAWIQFNLIQP